MIQNSNDKVVFHLKYLKKQTVQGLAMPNILEKTEARPSSAFSPKNFNNAFLNIHMFNSFSYTYIDLHLHEKEVFSRE